MASVSTLKRTFCGVDFVLKASTEAWAQVEDELGVSYGVVLNRMEKKTPRLMDASAIFAAFVQPQGSVNGKAIRSLMPFDDGSSFMKLLELVAEVTAAGMPEAKKTDGDETEGTEQPGKPR